MKTDGGPAERQRNVDAVVADGGGTREHLRVHDVPLPVERCCSSFRDLLHTLQRSWVSADEHRVLVQFFTKRRGTGRRGRHAAGPVNRWLPLPPQRRRWAASAARPPVGLSRLLGTALVTIMVASTMAVAAPPPAVVTAPALPFEIFAAQSDPSTTLPPTTGAAGQTVDREVGPGDPDAADSTGAGTVDPIDPAPAPEVSSVSAAAVDAAPTTQPSLTQVPIQPFLVAAEQEPTSPPAGTEEVEESTKEDTTPATVWEGDILLYVPDERPPIPPAPPVSPSECYQRAKTMPLTVGGVYDRNLVAQMTHWLFECATGLSGFDDAPPTRVRGWNGASRGFRSLSEQVAAEAVVVAYCESEGFSPRELGRNNPWGYGGLFQMGTSEMRRFGPAGGSKFDPVDNAFGALTYFLYQYRNRGGWGGWSPWAVVNTSFDDEINNRVKIPILPRFTSTDPEFVGRRGPELPEWAIDPWSYVVPAWGGCPVTGGRWRWSVPLDS